MQSLATPSARQAKYAASALESECQAVATTPPGGRNAALNRASFNLGTLCGAGLLDAATAESALLTSALACGLSETEARASIRSGLTAGQASPRTPNGPRESATPRPKAAAHTTAAPKAVKPNGRLYPNAEAAFASVAKATGGRVATVWPYPCGTYAVARFESPEGKTYRPAHHNGHGWHLGDPEGLLPLHYAGFDGFDDDLGTLVVVEGEQCVLAGAAVGLCAVTSPHGASAAARADWQPLAGRDIVILPDNDEAGRKYADDVARILTALEPPASVRIVELPDLPPGGDICEFIADGGGINATEPDDLRKAVLYLADQAPAWTPPPTISTHASGCEDCPTNPITADSPGVPGEVSVENWDASDTGFARAFEALHGGAFRYGLNDGKWYVWAGHTWQPDARGAVYAAAIDTADRHRAAALAVCTAGNNEPMKAVRFWTSARNRRRIEDALAVAGRFPQFGTLASDWNNAPHLLAFQNGVVDLRTGAFHPGKRSDLINRAVPHDYNPNAKCPRWTRFLSEIFGGDDELTGFARLALGYTLTGEIREQCFFLLHGAGANGKSALLDTIKYCLGPDLASVTGFNTFLRQYGHESSNDLAALAGARFVAASETCDGRRFDEARIKSLTGGEAITARFLFKEFFSFTPQFKIWLAANHLPDVRDDSPAFWRRVRLIPFEKAFTGTDADPNLSDKLRAEAEGVLALAVQDARRWYAHGLTAPAAVVDATATYRADTDPLGDFINGRCVVGEGLAVKAADAHAAYVDHCDEARIPERERLNMKRFGAAMKARHPRERRRNGYHYLGIGLADAESVNHRLEL